MLDRVVVRRICLAAVIVLVILAWPGTLVQAARLPDYRIDAYAIDIDLQADGIAVITEQIDFYLLKDQTRFRFAIPYDNASKINLDAVRVSAGQKMNQPTPDPEPDLLRLNTTPAATTLLASQQTFLEVVPATPGDRNQPLTYEVADDGQSMRIVVNVTADAWSLRTIQLSYRLARTCLSFGDTVEFRRTLFNTPVRLVIGNPHLTIHLPEGATDQAWCQPISRTGFSVRSSEGNQIEMQAPSLPAGQTLTAVCLLPAASVPKAAISPEPIDRAALLAAIQAEVNGQTRQQEMRNVFMQLNWLLLFLSALLLLLIYMHYGNGSIRLISRHKKTESRIMTDRPAVLATLLRNHRPGSLLLSTLIDLVRRQELSLDGHVFTDLHPVRPHFLGYAAYEIFLIQWLFGRVTQSATLSTAQIRKYALDRKTAMEFQAYYEQFINLLLEEVELQGLVDPQKSRLGRILSWILAGFFLTAAVLMFIFLRSAQGLTLFAPALVFAGYGFNLRHLTAAGFAHRQVARSLRKNLLSLASQQPDQPQPEPAMMAAALPVAIAMRITTRYLGQIEQFNHQHASQVASFLQVYALLPAGEPTITDLSTFSRDLLAMESMLSASLYLAAGIHLFD